MKVSTIDRDGVVRETSLEFDEGSTWCVEISLEPCRGRRFEGYDLFDALCELRRCLESYGIRLLCNASRRDCYPSGMSRSMGAGRQVYYLEIGKPATLILDGLMFADEADVGTVDEQARAFSEWRASLSVLSGESNS